MYKIDYNLTKVRFIGNSFLTSLDVGYSRFVEIKKQVVLNNENIQTEEDAKIQIITRILTECLGWDFANIGAERKNENGFTDYLISRNNQNCITLEAKRIGRVKVSLKDRSRRQNLKLNGPALSDCQEGINQAAAYAHSMGTPVAILTDGEVWIVFKPIIIGEDFKNKQAIVFPSLDAVDSNFSQFYELIGRKPFSEKLYGLHFDEIHNSRLLLSEDLEAPIKEHEIRRIRKSALAFELEPIFDNFFNRLTGEEDPDIIIDCFVETRESRIADYSLEKMTTKVLGNITAQGRDLNQEFSDFITQAVEVDAGETVFIVGPTGAGKSTFIERFFRKSLAPETRSRCVPVRLNFLKDTGTSKKTLTWAIEELIKGLEKQIYKSGVPSWDDLLGLFFSEYQRQSQGTGAKLYEQNKPEFHVEFGKYMAMQVENDREGYLRKILADIVRNRKKIPIIIADNTDEFPPEFKQQIFQQLQALRIHAGNCIIIFPITDKSAWSFTKTDIYSIYQSKSFFLPTPPPREVFRKRIAYLKEKIANAQSEGKKTNFFTSRGIRVSVINLNNFARVLEEALVNNDYCAKTLGEFSNFNICKPSAPYGQISLIF